VRIPETKFTKIHPVGGAFHCGRRTGRADIMNLILAFWDIFANTVPLKMWAERPQLCLGSVIAEFGRL